MQRKRLPHPLSCTSVHHTQLVPSGVSSSFIYLFSLTFSNRPDEVISIWRP